MTPEIKTAETAQDILKCWLPIFALRPMLSLETFVGQIQNQQSEGYKLLYIEDEVGVQAILGYRIFSMLYIGKQLYIDDLSTLETARGKGFGSALLEHVYQNARENNCLSVQLDSGPSRTDAHRLYLNEKFTITSFHFGKNL